MQVERQSNTVNSIDLISAGEIFTIYGAKHGAVYMRLADNDATTDCAVMLNSGLGAKRSEFKELWLTKLPGAKLVACKQEERTDMENTNKDIELKDTAEMMTSDDYKERFRAEYYQNVTRYKKLKNMVGLWDKGELKFTPTCPRSTYDLQLRAMADYIAILEARAVMENISLKHITISREE
jgi:hypothetical protein